MSDTIREERDSMAQLSDHELLAHIAIRTDHLAGLVQMLGGKLREVIEESKTPRTYAVGNDDLRLLRRKFVGPKESDWEER